MIDSLYLLQFGCLMLMVFLIMVMVATRPYILNIDKEYERSRWIFVIALLLLAIHYGLQMKFGFRTHGDDVGALINLLFYFPVGNLLCMSHIRIESRNKTRRRYWIICLTGMTIHISLFAIGWFIYHSLHMLPIVYTMVVVDTLFLTVLLFSPFKDLKAVREQIKQRTANDIDTYDKANKLGALALFNLCLFVPFITLQSEFLWTIGLLMLLSFFVYTINFIILGFRVAPVSEVISEEVEEEEVKIPMTEKQIQQMEGILEQWYVKGGYRDRDLTLTHLAYLLGYSQREISQYLAYKHGVTFRTWLSNLRIQRAKELLIEHPEYSNEVVAQECGFVSRTYFQNLFREATGRTPKDWKKVTVLEKK